jgi:hypothetical protein
MGKLCGSLDKTSFLLGCKKWLKYLLKALAPDPLYEAAAGVAAAADVAAAAGAPSAAFSSWAA